MRTAMDSVLNLTQLHLILNSKEFKAGEYQHGHLKTGYMFSHFSLNRDNQQNQHFNPRCHTCNL